MINYNWEEELKKKKDKKLVFNLLTQQYLVTLWKDG